MPAIGAANAVSLFVVMLVGLVPYVVLGVFLWRIVKASERISDSLEQIAASMPSKEVSKGEVQS